MKLHEIREFCYGDLRRPSFYTQVRKKGERFRKRAESLVREYTYDANPVDIRIDESVTVPK